MFDQQKFTAQNALDLIETGTPPLRFETGAAVYRAAVKRIAKTAVPGMITCDLSTIPMDLAFVDLLFERLNRQPPASKKERQARAQWKSRLRTIARRLEDVPVVCTTAPWENCLDAIRQLAAGRGMNDQSLIPITSSLRAAAVEDGLEPSGLTGQWLTAVLKKSSRKRRKSLKSAAQIFDDFWPELPSPLRPLERFGSIEINSSMRRGRPLPPRVAEELEAYLSQRVAGKTAEGFTRSVTVQAGIKEQESTNIYRQATGWLFDALCEAGELDPDANIGMADLARLDWLGRIAFEALADANTDDGEPQAFSWRPIAPKTIYNRTASLITMFRTLHPDFLKQQYELHDPSSPAPEVIGAEGLGKILRGHFKQEMTDAHRAFCRTIILDQNKQRLLLNMHMICWSEAQERWKGYGAQRYHEQMQTMNLCILSAILAMVVHIPFRARTVTSMVLEGKQPDLSLPTGQKRIEFHVAPARMKVPKTFDAILADTKQSRPRQILDWFIAGPRRELLHNPRLLRPENRKPDLLFCGIGRARYNRVLAEWTEDVGLRMTTHLFRHALASILINCCGCPLEDAARMLGNSVATAERQYVFQDLMRRREETMRQLAGYRENLTETHHPGRKRKQ